MSCRHQDNGSNVKCIACSEVFLTPCQPNTHWHTLAALISWQVFFKKVHELALASKYGLAWCDNHSPQCCLWSLLSVLLLLSCWSMQQSVNMMSSAERRALLAKTHIPESEWIGNTAACQTESMQLSVSSWLLMSLSNGRSIETFVVGCEINHRKKFKMTINKWF